MDVDETNKTVSIGNVQNTLEEEQTIPEKDSYVNYMQRLLHTQQMEQQSQLRLLQLKTFWNNLIQQWRKWTKLAFLVLVVYYTLLQK